MNLNDKLLDFGDVSLCRALESNLEIFHVVKSARREVSRFSSIAMHRLQMCSLHLLGSWVVYSAEKERLRGRALRRSRRSSSESSKRPVATVCNVGVKRLFHNRKQRCAITTMANPSAS